MKAQDLHRDDFIWQQTRVVERSKYQVGQDVGMGLLVAGVKTSRENGATLVSNSQWSPSRASFLGSQVDLSG